MPTKKTGPTLASLNAQIAALQRQAEALRTKAVAAVVARIKAYALAHEHPLLERFAEGIAEIVRGEFAAPWVRVRVAKLGALPGVKEIGVEIVR